MKILLDTNFVVSCVKNKIDFVSVADEITDEKIEWIIPFEVMEEIEKLANKQGEKMKDRQAAKIGLEMIKVFSPTIINIHNKNVDEGIKKYIEGKDIVLATLDKNLKKKIKNKILTIIDDSYLEIL